MAAQEYVGQIVLTVNSREYEVKKCSPKVTTGRKPVKTMNRTGRSKGFVRGMESIELDMTVAIPLGSAPTNWAAMENAKVTITPLGSTSPLETYVDAYVTEVGTQYQMEDDAVIDIKMIALRKVDE